MIAVTNLGVYFTGKELFNNISFTVNPKDRIGLVGKNGVGKSTLLNIVAGLRKPDEGSVAIPEGTTIGYLPQEIKATSDKSIFDEAMTAFDKILKLEKEIEQINQRLTEITDYESDEYADLLDRLSVKHDVLNHIGANSMESEIEKVLKGLGFEAADFQRPIKEFSGGWQMRVELAKLLLAMPDLLLLDEPTNHLDIESILWLEDFFNNYPGAIMMVSHDKMFLDNITNRTIEIVMGKVYDYQVPYTKFLTLREERLEQQHAAYKNQQRQIAQHERFIERFRAKSTKAKQVQSKIKMVNKIERIEFDDMDTQTIKFRFPPAPRSGDIALEGKQLSKHYGDNVVIKDLDFIIERGERVAFVGKNGEGKSTLVKMITGDVEFEGKLRLGHNVEMGYYAQIQEGTLDENLSVLKTIENEATNEWASIARIRGLLGAFLFGEDDVEKRVKVLSGGEKSRLALARLLLKPVNLLILDEPTNHLDISAKEVLKEALQQYDGTLIVVSHDRDFLQGLTTKTFEFANHRVKEHLGDVAEFLLAHKAESFRDFEMTKKQTVSGKKNEASDNGSANKDKYQERKQQEKEVKKLKNAISNYEKEIEKLEAEIGELEHRMQQPDFYSNEAEATEVVQYHKKIEEQLNKTLGLWDRSIQELEKSGHELEGN